MVIKDYTNAVKKGFETSMNQGRFMREVFKAAGYDRFPSSSDEDYAKKICNGTKSITKDMVTGFPIPYKIDELADYYAKHIGQKKAVTLANAFNLKEEKIDTGLLSKALAMQFFCFVEVGGSNHEAEDIVASSYMELKNGEEIEGNSLLPFYPGDRARIENSKMARHYDKYFYDKFEHVWLIRNDGKVAWRNRRLVCKSKDSQVIKMNAYEVDIPDTDPGGKAEVSLQVDARGMESTFTSTWEMEDSSGNNCFPNEKWLFKFTVTVNNQLWKPTP